MAIEKESAEVFRGGGRRYFTLRAAARAEARALINRNCYCDYCDHEGYGREHLPCKRHQEANFEPLVAKLAARFIRNYRKQKD